MDVTCQCQRPPGPLMRAIKLESGHVSINDPLHFPIKVLRHADSPD